MVESRLGMRVWTWRARLMQDGLETMSGDDARRRPSSVGRWEMAPAPKTTRGERDEVFLAEPVDEMADRECFREVTAAPNPVAGADGDADVDDGVKVMAPRLWPSAGVAMAAVVVVVVPARGFCGDVGAEMELFMAWMVASMAYGVGRSDGESTYAVPRISILEAVKGWPETESPPLGIEALEGPSKTLARTRIRQRLIGRSFAPPLSGDKAQRGWCQYGLIRSGSGVWGLAVGRQSPCREAGASLAVALAPGDSGGLQPGCWSNGMARPEQLVAIKRIRAFRRFGWRFALFT
jgi:hypothetical protein